MIFGLTPEFFSDRTDDPDDFNLHDLMIPKKKPDPDHMNNNRVNHTAKATGVIREEDPNLKNEFFDVIFQRIESKGRRQTNADT